MRTLIALALVAASVTAAERGRTTVVQVPDPEDSAAKLYTLQTDAKSTIRAGSVWVTTGRRRDEGVDPRFWQANRDRGLNAMRVICFDPWMKSRGYEPYVDWSDKASAAALLARLDEIVDIGAKMGMYVIINYHDVGKFDKEYLAAFWKAVAPRYKARTHVLYEIANEPVEWFPGDYKESTIADLASISAGVRQLAPESTLIVLTFANASGEGASSMLAKSKIFAAKAPKIDWKKTVVGFHPYDSGPSTLAIRSLAHEFPAISTESNYPPGVPLTNVDGGDTARSKPMRNDEQYVNQSLERLGIGWMQWQIDTWPKFEGNMALITADAKQKKWEWKPDPQTGAKAPNARIGKVANGSGAIAITGDPGVTGTAKIAWSVVQGPGEVTFAPADAAKTAASATVAGTYRIRFQVEADGWTVADETDVTWTDGGLMPAVTVAKTEPGLAYAFYNASFTSTAGMDKAKPTSKGVAKEISVAVDGGKDKHYGLIFSGLLDIPADGVYSFGLDSDDGSVFLLDGKKIIDIDGFRGLGHESTTGVGLAKGLHRLEVRYFQAAGGKGVTLRMGDPGGSLGAIPAARLLHESK
jgi:hypothetical protein